MHPQDLRTSLALLATTQCVRVHREDQGLPHSAAKHRPTTSCQRPRPCELNQAHHRPQCSLRRQSIVFEQWQSFEAAKAPASKQQKSRLQRNALRRKSASLRLAQNGPEDPWESMACDGQEPHWLTFPFSWNGQSSCQLILLSPCFRRWAPGPFPSPPPPAWNSPRTPRAWPRRSRQKCTNPRRCGVKHPSREHLPRRVGASPAQRSHNSSPSPQALPALRRFGSKHRGSKTNLLGLSLA
mmetsp:Transcript_127048/g.301755  ORF Transcript_127048/g.301755 Transcript_127048/m.301755 type:complete len:240 (-) Transcript_127048:1019-1738(-)